MTTCKPIRAMDGQEYCDQSDRELWESNDADAMAELDRRQRQKLKRVADPTSVLKRDLPLEPGAFRRFVAILGLSDRELWERADDDAMSLLTKRQTASLNKYFEQRLSFILQYGHDPEELRVAQRVVDKLPLEPNHFLELINGDLGRDLPSSNALMDRVRDSSDRVAWLGLYDRWFVWMQLVKRFDGDVVQETFVRIWEKRSTWKSDSFGGWLNRIASNIKNDGFRKGKKTSSFDQEVMSRMVAAVSETPNIENEELREVVQRNQPILTERQSRYILFLLAEMSKEIRKGSGDGVGQDEIVVTRFFPPELFDGHPNGERLRVEFDHLRSTVSTNQSIDSIVVSSSLQRLLSKGLQSRTFNLEEICDRFDGRISVSTVWRICKDFAERLPPFQGFEEDLEEQYYDK